MKKALYRKHKVAIAIVLNNTAPSQMLSSREVKWKLEYVANLVVK